MHWSKELKGPNIIIKGPLLKRDTSYNNKIALLWPSIPKSTFKYKYRWGECDKVADEDSEECKEALGRDGDMFKVKDKIA